MGRHDHDQRDADRARAGTAQTFYEVILIVNSGLSARIEGMEITQGVQHYGQPYSNRYQGVRLVPLKKTVVRVFADYAGNEPRGRRPPFGVILDRRGAARPSAVPHLRAESVATEPQRRGALRGGARLGERRLHVRAPRFVDERQPHDHGAARGGGLAGGRRSAVHLRELRRDADLGAQRDRLPAHLEDVPLQRPEAAAVDLQPDHDPGHAVHAGAHELGADGPHGGLRRRPARRLREAARAVTGPDPLRHGVGRLTNSPTWRAVEFAPSYAILEAAQAYHARVGNVGTGTIGIFVAGGNPGVASGAVAVASALPAPGGLWRPTTSIAHEVFHVIGFPHASKSCGASDGEAWPVADGRMNSVGLDTSSDSSARGALPRVRRPRRLAALRPHVVLPDPVR